MGLVKKCRNIQTGEIFAVKIIKSREEEMIQNIRKEYLHLSKMFHENIIRVLELLIDRNLGEIYLIMEYFESRELFVVISSIGHYDGRIIRKNCESVIYPTTKGDQVSSLSWSGSSRPKAKQHSCLQRR